MWVGRIILQLVIKNTISAHFINDKEADSALMMYM